MSWNEAAFGRDDGLECEKCGSKTYVTDDDDRGYVSYACENDKCGETFAAQYDLDPEETDPEVSDEIYDFDP